MFSSYPFVPVEYGEVASRHYLAHEWGHIVGHLPDHYISAAYGQTVSYSSYAPDTVCAGWCSGEFSSYAELMAYDCAQQTSVEQCNDRKMEFLPCYWHEQQCVNVMDHCAALETEQACLEVPFCGFIHGITQTSWHGASCVPYNTGLDVAGAVVEDRYEIYVETSYPVIDVGGDCEPGTGCYTCGYTGIGSFRPDAFTLMRQDFLNHYGTYHNAQIELVLDAIVAGAHDDGFWEYHEPFVED